jgi:predicted RNase H-like HicB family nuclease
LTGLTKDARLPLVGAVAQDSNCFRFTGSVLREGDQFVSLCLELDVASAGRTVREAKRMLAEAVTLYLEVCFENNLPHLRPVPREEDPRLNPRIKLVENFPLKVDFKVHAVA